MRLLFSEPDARQIEGRLTSAFQTQAVRGQAEAWNVRIIISRRKVLIPDSLEKNSEIHNQTINVFRVLVNSQFGSRHGD